MKKSIIASVAYLFSIWRLYKLRYDDKLQCPKNWHTWFCTP